MSKKSKRPQSWNNKRVSTRKAEELARLASLRLLQDRAKQANQQLMAGDFEGTVKSCQLLLGLLPQRALLRAEVLSYMGLAYGMLQQFPQSYEALTEAVSISPDDPNLWYNRGLASRYTIRFGQSLRDYERAVELAGTGELAKKAAIDLKIARDLAQKSIKLRREGFTLDDLIEQEELFQRGLKM